jgi:hypothetical protein
MGYGIMAYRIDAAELLSIPGSLDVNLVSEILKAYNNEIEREEDSEGAKGSHRLALLEIVTGTCLGAIGPHVYGYALEYICEFLGEYLSPSPFDRCSEEELKFVDETLKLPVSLRSMAGFDPPIPLPNPNGFPGVGYWSPERIAEAKTVLERDVVSVRQGYLVRLASETGRDLTEVYHDIRDWILDSKDGEMIVGFYH